ncbi:MAG: dTMP kinase [Candidatus Omnitrophica bacterium]|nr:dTMP kinase [Candidatus Omnitrophota bacterium]
MKGKFITFEGSEGCGKSTQSRLLYAYLKAKGKRVIYLREPGATKVSEKIRDILLDAKNQAISPQCEMLLYMAARAQIVAEIIEPSLKKGAIVICDRFLDSTLAYQGYGLGVDIDLIRRIGNFATRGIKPDLTFLLDLAVKKGLKHREASLDRIEMRSVKYHLRVRQGYLKLARQEPKRIKVVKVEKDKSQTQAKIRELAEKYVL